MPPISGLEYWTNTCWTRYLWPTKQMIFTPVFQYHPSVPSSEYSWKTWAEIITCWESRQSELFPVSWENINNVRLSPSQSLSVPWTTNTASRLTLSSVYCGATSHWWTAPLLTSQVEDGDTPLPLSPHHHPSPMDDGRVTEMITTNTVYLPHLSTNTNRRQVETKLLSIFLCFIFIAKIKS